MTIEQVIAMIELAKREQSKGEPWMRISPELALEILRDLVSWKEHICEVRPGAILSIVPRIPGIPKE